MSPLCKIAIVLNTVRTESRRLYRLLSTENPFAVVLLYASISMSKKRQEHRAGHDVSGRGGVERSQSRIDRTVPGTHQGHRFSGSADCFIERTHQLPDHSP